MPRMRTLKPEAAASETLSLVPREVRWTFGMLWTHLDDEGRGVLNPRLIKAAIYPLDDDMTPEVIAGELDQLEAIGSLCFYEIDGKEYIHVPAWHEHQHPNRKVESRLPACPKTDHSPTPHAQRSEPSVSEQGDLTSVVVVVEEGRGEVDGGGGVAICAAHTAQTIVAEWMDHCDKRPPGQVVGQASKLIQQMLDEGIDSLDIRRGLRLWNDKGLHPNTLPSVVHEAMNSTGRSRSQDEVDAQFERAARRLGVAK